MVYILFVVITVKMLHVFYNTVHLYDLQKNQMYTPALHTDDCNRTICIYSMNKMKELTAN